MGDRYGRGSEDVEIAMYSAMVCSMVFTLYLAFLLYRSARRQRLDVLTPKIVLQGLEFGRSVMDLVRLHGQRGGFVGWLLETLNSPRSYELHVSEKLATIKQQGGNLEYHYVLPVNQITAVYCDHHIPLVMIVHGIGIGAGLGTPVGNVGIIFFGALAGLLLALWGTTTCISLAAGHRSYGFRFEISASVPKEQVFAAFEELRRLLVRTQLGLLPTAPPPPSLPVTAPGQWQVSPPARQPEATASGSVPPPWQAGASNALPPPAPPTNDRAAETLHGFSAQK